MTWSGLTQDFEHRFLCSTCQVCQMTKKERESKKYGLRPPKIAESDPGSWFVWILWVPSIYNMDTSQNTLSACTHNDRPSHWLV
jgi:hypothetical protein